MYRRCVAGASADIAVAGAAPADAAAESLAQLRQREDAVYDEQLERPCKTVRESLTIDVRMRHSFIDFEGRSDGKSIKTILSHVKPRKLILVCFLKFLKFFLNFNLNFLLFR